MRISRLSLTAWGHLRDTTLDLSAEGALFVVYGPNEAGKSTTKRAVTALLYGIDHKTPDAHTIPGAELRLGATLTSRDGTLEVVRKKGRVKTLLSPGGEPIDEAPLVAMLGGIGRETFETMFGLDHENLRHGGAAILEGKGDVGEALFAAGSGLVRTHELLRALRAEAEEIFTPQARTKPLNQACAQHDHAEKRAKELATSPEKVREQEEAVARARASRDALAAERVALEAERADMKRLERVMPILAQRRALSERAAVLRRGPILEESAPERRERAEQAERDAAPRVARLEDDLATLQKRRDELPAVDDRLARDPSLALAAGLAAYRERETSAAEERARAEALEERLAERLRRLGDADPTRARRIVSTASGANAEALAHRELLAKKKAAEEELARAETRAREARAAAERVAPPADDAALTAAIAAARRAGDLDDAIARARERLEASRSERDRAMARLRGFSGDAEALARAPLPAPATVAAAEEELAAIAARERTNAADSRVTGSQREERRVALAALVGEGAVPTEEDLARARAGRDDLVARAGKRGGPAADAIRAAVVLADEIADRLRREADRVAQRAHLEAELAGAERRTADLEAERAEIAARRADAEARWARAWEGTGVTPEAPTVMRGWLAAKDEVLARITAHDAARRELERDERRRAELLAALCAADGGPAVDLLAASLARAEAELAARGRARAAFELATKARDDAAIAVASRAAEVAQAEAELEAWGRRWRAFAAEAGLGEAASVDEVTSTLLDATDIVQADDDLAGARRRLVTHVAPMRAFEDRVRELARIHAPELEAEPATVAAQRLAELHHAAKETCAAREDLDRQIELKRDALREESVTLEAARAEIAARMRAAGASTREELLAAERASADLRKVEASLADLELALAAASEGASIAELEQACAATDRNAFFGRFDAIDRRLEELASEIPGASEDIGNLEAGLELMTGAGAAHEMAAAQAAAATARAHAERWLRLRLATELLAARVDRYRRENEAPLVGRAGELLAAITGGSLVGLRTSLGEDDTPVLVGLRSGGKEVPVSGMSDGARDALYLSLRIASLERYAETRECPPLVLDDVLVHFDDDRAGAVLEVLSSLSRKMQVLFFTHHARLVELAGRCVPAGRLAVLDLARRD